MSLRSTVFQGVVTAINSIGDLAKNIEYHAVTVGSYDRDMDTYTNVERVFTFRGPVYRQKEENQDWKKTDLIQTKVLIAGQDFLDNNVVPDEQDYMVIDGTRYEIKMINSVPQDACYIFTVRRV